MEGWPLKYLNDLRCSRGSFCLKGHFSWFLSRMWASGASHVATPPPTQQAEVSLICGKHQISVILLILQQQKR